MTLYYANSFFGMMDGHASEMIFAQFLCAEIDYKCTYLWWINSLVFPIYINIYEIGMQLVNVLPQLNGMELQNLCKKTSFPCLILLLK